MKTAKQNDLKIMVYILMGVSGSGKTLIGQKLAERTGLRFYDGDDYHPAANIKKMKSGHPLNDDDRRPWLKILSNKIIQWDQEGGAVLACSALKKSYRDILQNSKPESVRFVYLKGDITLIAKRISGRSEHFMPVKLLESQFETLEEPERAITVSVDQLPDRIVELIIEKLDKSMP